MTDFLTQRNGTWHFVRRVPTAYATLDARGIIRHSTRIRIADDRTGRRAARVAETMNEELERFWKGLAGGLSTEADGKSYDEARRRARSLGFDFMETSQLVTQPLERILERLEMLIERGLVQDAGARAAVLGTVKRPSAFPLSRLFEEYEASVRDEVRDFSRDQLRIWRNSHIRAVEQFIKVVGDKPITDLTDDDGIEYTEWWRERVVNDEVAAKTANRDIGQLSAMLKEMSIRRRLKLPDIFKGLRLKNENEKSRQPYDPEFIRSHFLGSGLDGMGEDAKLVISVMIETGLRPSEIVNLRKETIMLGARIPHVRIVPDGRRLKTEDSEREIPLVGVALEALKQRPNGFPKYRDKATMLSASVNKFLAENGLRPTKDHTLYSLRHSFKDRLISAEAPDSLIDSLMGHKTYKPKYGKGPSLDLKLKFLKMISFEAPVSA